jgi:hypothetical protein
MVLLFFLLIALGLLTALWIIFPAAGIKPPDPLPPRPQVVNAPGTPIEAATTPPAPTQTPSADASPTPAGEPEHSSGGRPLAATPAEPGAPAEAVRGTNAAPAGASPGAPTSAAAEPASIDLDQLRRALEQLLGAGPPPPSK